MTISERYLLIYFGLKNKMLGLQSSVPVSMPSVRIDSACARATVSHFAFIAPIAVLVLRLPLRVEKWGRVFIKSVGGVTLLCWSLQNNCVYGRIWVARLPFTCLMHLKLKRQCCIIGSLEGKQLVFSLNTKGINTFAFFFAFLNFCILTIGIFDNYRYFISNVSCVFVPIW